MAIFVLKKVEQKGPSEVPSTSDNYVIQTNDFLKSSSNLWAQTSFMLVRRKLVNVLLLSESNQQFAKITKTPFLVLQAHFLVF